MIAFILIPVAFAVIWSCLALRSQYRADRSMPEPLDDSWATNTWIIRKDTLCGKHKR